MGRKRGQRIVILDGFGRKEKNRGFTADGRCDETRLRLNVSPT